MIVLAALCAALATGLLVSSGTARGPDRRLAPVRSAARPTPWPAMITALLTVAVVAVAAGVGGPAAAVVATSLAAAAVTVLRLVRRHQRERRRDRRRRFVARACAAVAAQVRVGRVPTDALADAARDHAVLREPARTLQLGGDVVRALRVAARTPGQGGLGELAQAWQFAQHTGAPMAGVLDQVAAALREEQVTARTVAAELAGPRASGVVMAVLPLLGIGLGYLIGGDPIGFLVGGPAGWTCLLLGTGLALGGVTWLDRLARVSEPGQVES